MPHFSAKEQAQEEDSFKEEPSENEEEPTDKEADDKSDEKKEKITIVKNSKDVYIRRYGLTKKQRSILTQFGVSESYLNKMADRMNLIV